MSNLDPEPEPDTSLNMRCNMNPNKLMEVPAKIFGRNLNNCLDTGASKNFIRASFLDSLEFEFETIPLENPCQIQIGNETIVTVEETVQVPLENHKDTYMVTFHVEIPL